MAHAQIFEPPPKRIDKNVWPRRVNVITEDLKDLNIRKKLADERIGWQRAIMLRKIQMQRV